MSGMKVERVPLLADPSHEKGMWESDWIGEGKNEREEVSRRDKSCDPRENKDVISPASWEKEKAGVHPRFR